MLQDCHRYRLSSEDPQTNGRVLCHVEILKTSLHEKLKECFSEVGRLVQDEDFGLI